MCWCFEVATEEEGRGGKLVGRGSFFSLSLLPRSPLRGFGTMMILAADPIVRAAWFIFYFH